MVVARRKWANKDANQDSWVQQEVAGSVHAKEYQLWQRQITSEGGEATQTTPR